jgi:hypothetical protein
MNKIVLNNAEFEIDNFNKSTNYMDGNITSNGYVSILTNDVGPLNTLATQTITSIKIYHDESLIYNLENINAHIDTVNEYLASGSVSDKIDA